MAGFCHEQCTYCREEQIPKCREKHPEWFHGDEKERACHDMKEEHYDKIHAWVGENTLKRACVVFDPGPTPNESYCVEHLKVVLKELCDYTDGKGLS